MIIYWIYKNNRPVIPKQEVVTVVVDLGYLGIEKDFSAKLSALPSKRKRNQQDLSKEEIDYNRIHAKKRIVIEHTIC